MRATVLLLSIFAVVTTACGDGGAGPVGGGGGALVSGGTASGGAVASGGVATGGGAIASGGLPASGGAATGGSPTGGTSSGGADTSDSGGAQGTGGAPTGGTAAVGGNAASGGTANHSGPWKLLALGDSITGTTCYPQLLASKLSQSTLPEFELVGGVTNNQSCPSAPNVQTEGHGGYLVTNLLTDSSSGQGSRAELLTWAQAKPDVVLMHYGTNDVWNSKTPTQILTAYEAVLDAFRAERQDVLFFVSKIIPMNPKATQSCPTCACPTCANGVVALNAEINSDWAAAQSLPDSPVLLVDQWTGFNADLDTADGVHPTVAGADKMATRALETLASSGLF